MKKPLQSSLQFFFNEIKNHHSPIHLPQCVVLHDKVEYRQHCFTAILNLSFDMQENCTSSHLCQGGGTWLCQPVGYGGGSVTCDAQAGEFKIARSRLLNSVPAPGSDGQNHVEGIFVSLHLQGEWALCQRLPPLQYLDSTSSKLLGLQDETNETRQTNCREMKQKVRQMNYLDI